MGQHGRSRTVLGLRTSRFLSCGPTPTANNERARDSRRVVGGVAVVGGEMAPAGRGWSRTLGNTRSFVGNALGGLRGWSNLASWAVAGTLAYYLWVRPARQLQKEQEERAALAAASDPYRYVEKRKPIPDPQDTGLIYGKKKDPTK
uniref:Uncharacterized protein n=1 Tax=Oryza punctata TaxID=4537 RepID=A0A0E0LWT9_ORYPU